MRRWAIALCLALVAHGGPAEPRADGQEADPDALYANRADLPSAQAAAAEWERRLAGDPGDFEAAWKLARACYWLGKHAPAPDRRRRLEQGLEAGRKAAAARPSRPEGHFWMAANMGAMAEGFGLRAGIRYRAPVKAALEEALRLDPSYLGGAPDRVLGRWYFRVPRLLGGSLTKSEAHLLRALSYDSDAIITRIFLAETYAEMGRLSDARREYEIVIGTPPDPEWTPEDLEFKQQALAALARLRRR